MFSASETLIHPFEPACCLHVAGDDSFTFLQGQFSNDLRPAKEGKTIYGLWLNHKGRVLADSFVVPRASGEFFVVSYRSPASVIRERLEAYVIADDVTIADVTADWSALSIMAADAERLPPGLSPESGYAFPGRRGGRHDIECLFPAANRERERSRLAAARLIDETAMERRRIEAAVPMIPADIGPAELPQEGGLESAAVSFNKGCYLGQEVMARLHSMGQVRRRLLRVRGSGGLPPPRISLFQNGRAVGELRSAVATEGGFVALALVTLLNVDVARELQLGPDAPHGIVRIDSRP